MGAAWRSPKERDISKIAAMVGAVKSLGMETCATLGMLTQPQADALKSAGLDYNNHNLDSAPEFYGEIIHTREFQDRLDTLECVRDAGLKTCCGGIVGMGETARAARRPVADAREPARAPGIGADQPARAGRRHTARGHGAARPVSSSCA